MASSQKSRLLPPLFIAMGLLSSCGGGGGGGSTVAQPTPAPVNVNPTATADMVSLLVNTPTSLNLLENDTDTDGTLTGYRINSNPSSGSLSISGTDMTYTPNDGYTGTDSFTYAALDNSGGTSNSVTVSLTIEPLTTTALQITDLTVPSSNYESLNNADLNASILTSSPQTFTIPANTVSFALYLTGDDVDDSSTGLLLSNLDDPSNNALSSITRFFEYCSPGLCAGLLPRRSDQETRLGEWQFNLGTRALTLNDLNFTDVSLQLAVRTGPAPDLNAALPATLKVTPYFSATSVNAERFALVLDQFVAISNDNGIHIDLQPTVALTAPQYAEVSIDFNDPTTAEMVSQGPADGVNIFFVDSFSGAGGAGRLGISPGIPGTLGVQGPYNGILINAAATQAGPDDFYARTTAEFAFHEMGHYLGLLHTTEAFFGNDIIDDTDECLQATDDANNNQQADITECPDGLNPMFWTSDLNVKKALLTTGQRRLIYYSPIAYP